MEIASTAVFSSGPALPVAPPRVSLRRGRICFRDGRRGLQAAASTDKHAGGGGGVSVGGEKVSMSNSNYVVPLDKPTPGLIRPLAEILRDLNKRVSDNIIDSESNSIPWL